MDNQPCNIDGCDAFALRRGMCNKHYRRTLKADPARPTCSIEGCDKRVHGQGLCSTHHARVLRYGDPTRGRLPSRDPMFGTSRKTCATCRLVKDRSEFYPKAKGTVDGLNGTCKECCRDRQNRLWRDERPQMLRARMSARMRELNSTIEIYDAMLAECSGKCAGCGGTSIGHRLHIDHDHVTGDCRGLLCEKCNQRLMSVNDSVDKLRTLVEKHQVELQRLQGLVTYLQHPPALQFNPDGSHI